MMTTSYFVQISELTEKRSHLKCIELESFNVSHLLLGIVRKVSLVKSRFKSLSFRLQLRQCLMNFSSENR